MDEVRLNELAGRIKNDKARENWLTFMRGVELQQEAGDEDEVEYAEDDSDGVTPMLASDLKEIEKRRIQNVESSVDNPFTEEEQVVMPTGINARGRHGLTALHEAVMDGDLKRVRELVQQGADRYITDNSGHTPADKAALLGDLDILACVK